MAKRTKTAAKPAKKTAAPAPAKQGPTELPGNAKGIGEMFDTVNEARPDMNVTIETLGKKVTFVSSEHNNVLEILRSAMKNM